jgi:hypothetical protein
MAAVISNDRIFLFILIIGFNLLPEEYFTVYWFSFREPLPLYSKRIYKIKFLLKCSNSFILS